MAITVEHHYTTLVNIVYYADTATVNEYPEHEMSMDEVTEHVCDMLIHHGFNKACVFQRYLQNDLILTAERS